MSSSDSEKTASNPLHISENAQSSSSSSPSNSNIIVDLETTGTSRENPVDIVDVSKKGKQIMRIRKPKTYGKYLKIYDSRYQEWVDAGSSPSTSSGRKSNPKSYMPHTLAKLGVYIRLELTSLMMSKNHILGS